MKIVFSDIDHTLMYELTVADETIRLIEEIRAKAPFVLITARSLASVHQHVPEIPHDSLIVENGCVVYEGNEIDQAWDARIKPFLAVVEGYKEDLGLIIRPKTRMLSISMAQNNLTWNDADAIKDALPEELVMRTSSNETGDFLEMYPAVAGKAAAISYVSEKLGIAIEDTCALGDDLVDIEMLEACGYPLTHAEAREPVRDLVAKRGGYVAPAGSHAGTAAMLEETLRWLKA